MAPVDSLEQTDTIVPVAQPAPKPAEKPAEKPAIKPVEPKPAPVATPETTAQLDKYQKMDNRVRYGAYRIVGTASYRRYSPGG